MLAKLVKTAKCQVLLPERRYGLANIIKRSLLGRSTRVLRLRCITCIFAGRQELLIPESRQKPLVNRLPFKLFEHIGFMHLRRPQDSEDNQAHDDDHWGSVFPRLTEVGV